MDDSFRLEICPECCGTGLKTDANGCEYDDVCPFCDGEKVEESPDE